MGVTDVTRDKKTGVKVMAKKAKSGGHQKRSRVQVKGRKESENVKAKVQTFVENSPFDGSRGTALDASKLKALVSSGGGPESSKRKALMGSGPESIKK
jgi:hypothetical protein